MCIHGLNKRIFQDAIFNKMILKQVKKTIFARMDPHTIIEQKLIGLYKKWSGKTADRITPFPPSGSNRKYYRIGLKNQTAVGVFGEDPKENKAFLEFTKHFRKKGLPVPAIYLVDLKEDIYLLEDLGDVSLFRLLTPDEVTVPSRVEDLYKKSLENLLRFQLEGGVNLDYSLCYPVDTFNSQAIAWDLNYFKYYFLRPSGIPYDEYALERDFQKLIQFLKKSESGYFMYRDFQARNIFIRDNQPWFIDYQGGRKGPLQYDVASLLFQAKAQLPDKFRRTMLNYYLDRLQEVKKIDREQFKHSYYGFVLLRTLQVLGAYGYRGSFEQKPHFLESVRYALMNLRGLLTENQIPVKTDVLETYLNRLSEGRPEEKKAKGLTIDITSFSYLKYGYPKDTSGHGGGFVFDCRSLPNPGRHEEYRSLTGKDDNVIRFLEKEAEVQNFLESTFRIVGQAVDNYLVRRFDHLSVNFGCTGGQHRSVYCAEQLYKYLRDNYRINVNLSHKMLD